MPTFDELYDAELAKREAAKPQSFAQKLLTASAEEQARKSPVATPADQPLAAALRQAPSALGELDFTNPENLYSGATAHHWPPILMQAGAAALAGPEGGLGLRALLSGLGATAGYGYQSAVEPAVKGEPITTTPGGAASNFALGSVLEGLFGSAGKAGRVVSGKAGMEAGGEAGAEKAGQAALAARTGLIQGAEQQGEKAGQKALAQRTDLLQGAGQEAEKAGQAALAKRTDIVQGAQQEAEAARQKAQVSVMSAQDRVQREMLKHSQEAVQGVSDEEVARQVQEYLRPRPPIAQPTIETLSAEATPVRQSAQRNVASVFRGIGSKFDNFLGQFGDLQIPSPSFRPTIDAQRALLVEGKESISKGLDDTLRELEALDATPQAFEDLVRPSQMTKADFEARMRAPMVNGIFQPTPVTVNTLDGIRRKLTATVIDGASSPVDKRVANRVIQSMDQELGKVLPETAQAAWTVMRNEWHEANNVFSPNFRSMLFKADSPEKVADVLMGAGKGKVNRVLTVIGRTPPDELPLLSSAFADRLMQGDVLKNVEKVDPRVFRALFRGTGFDTPQGWTDALEKKIDFQSVMSNPVLAAGFNERLKSGMESLGTQRYQQALARAEQILRNTPDAGTRISLALAEAPPSQINPALAASQVGAPNLPSPGAVAGSARTMAMQGAPESQVNPAMAAVGGRLAGEQAGMKPFPIPSWLEHRVVYHTAIALTALGSWGAAHFTNHPVAAAVPLMYLVGGKALGALVANPTFGKLYYNALKSQNLEQTAFLLGRLAVASLTEENRPK